MDDDAHVSIAGTTERSGTYRKDAFLAEVAGPLLSKLRS